MSAELLLIGAVVALVILSGVLLGLVWDARKRLAWLERDYRRHLQEGKVSVTAVGSGGGGGGTGRYSAQLKDVETSGVPVRSGSVQIFEQDLGGNTRKLWPPEPPANS